MIDIKLLTFINLAKYRSFTKTAKVMNITQPAVTQHIQALEDYYQVRLINRDRRIINLTEEGYLLLKYAEMVNVLSNEIHRLLINKNSIQKKHIIGCTLTIGEYVLPPILVDFKKAYPNIEILMHVENTEVVLNKLNTEEIDLGLVEGTYESKKYRSKLFRRDELVLVTAADSPLAQYNSINLDELSSLKFIMRESGSGTRKAFEDALLSKGYDINNLNIYMEIGNLNSIKYLVEEGLGCTVISRDAIQKELRMDLLKIIPIEGLKMEREYNFIYLDGYIYSDFINNFMDFCINFTERAK